MNRVLKAVGSVAIAALLAATLSVVSEAPAAQAADASQFDPGNLISDAVFFDSQAMSVNEIQQFLVAQVPVCHSSYACLSTYRQNTPSMGGTAGRCNAYDGRSNESAADIIFRVGLACGISSRVMLVLLEKEQSLVTSSTPSKGRFDSATGMACPDTAPCDPNYAGLFYQIYYAARQFKTYAAVPSAFNYQAGRVNYILFSPNRDCGSSPVYIANQATAGLYNYTPYQPNAAALANLYGTGDGCSAYGNRNFWRLYTDWFGSTQANTIGAQAIAALYNSLGGPNGSLGAQLSAVSCTSSFRDCGVQYRSGSIYWSERTGAWPVYEPVRAAYWAAGGSAGQLGSPTSNPIPISQNGGGIGQVFENGSIYVNAAAGAYPVYEPVRAAYFTTGGAAGSFGWPAGLQACSASWYGCTQAFQNGYIGSQGGSTMFSVTGPMATAYRSAGGPAGPLGVVASNVVTVPQNGGGTGQSFELGSIYAGKAGTFPVVGNVKTAYFALGGAAGSFGWPTGAQLCSKKSPSCIQAFQNGYLASSSAKSSLSVTGKMAAAYTANGGPAGALGLVTSALVSIPQNGGGSGQAFETGSIYDSAAGGTHAVSGPMLTEYFRQSGAAGAVGWPTSDQSCALAGGGCQQSFQKMTIFSTTKSAATVSNQIAPAYAAAGGLGGVLGAPTSGTIQIPQNGGGVGQAFSNGSVYASSAGAFAVSGALKTEYFRQGGSAGTLGWPTGAAVCDAAGTSCSQAFQGGMLVASASGAWTVAGDILTAYIGLGGVAGAFGAAASAELPISQNGGGTGQAFVNGSVYSSHSGTFGVSGAIRTEYFRQGGSAGALGWPTAAAKCGTPAGTCSQAFQGGTVYGDSAKAWGVSGVILSSYTTLGGPTGAFGLPNSTAITIPQNGGGFGQSFQNGSIYAGSAGAFGVSGAIRDEYFRQNGAAGPLGWPTGNPVCASGGTSCTQQFQGGTVTR